MAVIDPALMRMTKQSINRNYEIMGLGPALEMNLDTAIQVESMETPERRRFKDIAKADGLKAAIAWRDSRFEREG